MDANFKGKMLNHTVVPTKAFFDLTYASVDMKSRSRYTNERYITAIYVYWSGVLGIAIALNVLSASLAAGWPPKVLAKAVRGVQSHLSIPPLLPKQSHPGVTRLEGLVILGFVVLSVILSSVNIEALRQSVIYPNAFDAQLYALVGRRVGNLALANLPLIWVFSMRNNPLIWAAGWSFATFNHFHRWIARVTVVQVIAHAIAYTKAEFLRGGQKRYFAMFDDSAGELWWNMGIVATVCFAFLLVFAMPALRYRFYDVFLLVHIALAVVAFVGVWYHLAEWMGYWNGYMWPVVGVWVLERLARALRVLVTCASSGGMGTASVSWDEDADIVRLDVTRLLEKLHPKPGNAYYL